MEKGSGQISKADVLAVLETNPAYKLQVKNYSFPLETQFSTGKLSYSKKFHTFDKKNCMFLGDLGMF